MKLVLASLMVVALAACAPAPQTGGPESASSTSAASAPMAARSAAIADAAKSLSRHHWQLASAVDKSGQRIGALFARADKPLQLDFTAHGVAISNTCNRMQASYSTAGNRIRIGALAATLMACPDANLQALDKAAAQYLSGTFEFEVGKGTPPTLALMTATGDKLAFNGIPTAATRFGSDGSTMFLEVAAETKPCNQRLMPSKPCLYVRELHYGSNGIRAGVPGAWEVLGQDIEGYVHEPGVRNVLRVKRYKVANPPADASSVAYVLDMVVESELPPHKQQ